MKHCITFWFLVVTLLVGVATTSIPKSETELHRHRIISMQQNSLPDHHQTTFSANNLLLGIGVKSGRIRNGYSYQQLSFRTLPSSSKASRIKHSAKLEHHKYISGLTLFLQNPAFNQTSGYYLYHLQKLLI